MPKINNFKLMILNVYNYKIKDKIIIIKDIIINHETIKCIQI